MLRREDIVDIVLFWRLSDLGVFRFWSYLEAFVTIVGLGLLGGYFDRKSVSSNTRHASYGG